MDERVELCRQRMLEEELRALTSIDKDQRELHLEWARMYEERLRQLGQNGSGAVH